MFNLYQVEQAVALELGDESKLTRMVALKPLCKQIIEHKDVNKVAIQLNTIILSLKTEALVLLKTFSEFSDIWNKVNYMLNIIRCCAVKSKYIFKKSYLSYKESVLSRKHWFHGRIHTTIIPLSALVLTRTCKSLPIKASKKESRGTQKNFGAQTSLYFHMVIDLSHSILSAFVMKKNSSAESLRNCRQQNYS